MNAWLFTFSRSAKIALLKLVIIACMYIMKRLSNHIFRSTLRLIKYYYFIWKVFRNIVQIRVSQGMLYHAKYSQHDCKIKYKTVPLNISPRFLRYGSNSLFHRGTVKTRATGMQIAIENKTRRKPHTPRFVHLGSVALNPNSPKAAATYRNSGCRK